MKQLKLLIVDDDPVQVQLLSDKIREKNVELKRGELEIITEIFNSGEEALVKFTSNDYDAAVVDLKLSNDLKSTEDGNEVIKEIKKKMRFPVFVLSNYLQDIDPALGNETDVFKIKERSTTDFGVLVDEIVLIYKSGITYLFGVNGELATFVTEALSELFWERIAVSWKYLLEKIPDQSIRLKIISRQLSSILKEKMEINDLGFGKTEPFEMYMIPPLKKHIYTGDIIEKDDNFIVVLTPACDILPREEGKPKIDFVLVAKLIELKKHDYLKDCWIEGKLNEAGKNKGTITNIIQNKKAEYHFLPPFNKSMGYVINFTNIYSIKYDDLKIENGYKVIASIMDPFMKNIISRFTNFYNRLGQPDFDEDRILDEMKAL
jgi:CheY-like chemotaxis protein